MISLYKKDSKGKIRVWSIRTEGDRIIQLSGLVGGALVTNEKVCTPKNVGKKNATTGAEQAILELQSAVQEKKYEGYFSRIKEAVDEEVILPMLAKDFKKEEKKIDWKDAYEQPKFDGMRCLSIIDNEGVTLMSRDGKIINTVEHISFELSHIDLEDGERIILDGELYCHGLNFQENMRLIKKYREGETERISYHIYDVVLDKPFAERSAFVSNILDNRISDHLTKVPTRKVISKATLDAFHAENLSNGYEGSMVRWGKEGYKLNGRSSNLLKYKDFQDLALKIVDIEPATQRPEWGVPVFEIDGKRFRAGMKFSHEERKEFLINRTNYIGTTAELRFFEYSEDGIPRFPVCVGFRLDK